MASSKDTASAMKVVLNNVGKRFNYHWIFRGINSTWNSSNTIAIKGNNGAGKSTLISILSGLASPNEGIIEWWMDDHKIDSEKIFSAPNELEEWCTDRSGERRSAHGRESPESGIGQLIALAESRRYFRGKRK